ncbi:beta carbonic anhydrase 1-like [Gigantopelta aegis]|uniref:beta carbonic anhydrase 1-like n=1 Tax=Gigantopelta aegis TaxID=1735272 RepID=UPI001B88CE73|nr:beta carbonic anhydrase 1-like [Gigantopelta aegis]
MPGISHMLKGILRYKKIDQVHLVEQFKQVRENPEPLSVFFTCIDSRVLASRFTNSQVGETFFVRNAGNIVPHVKISSKDIGGSTEPGALELGCVVNNIRHVVVCGHSDCKAMNMLYGIKHDMCNHAACSHSPLRAWLQKHGAPTVKKFAKLSPENNFSGPLIFQGETEENSFAAYIDPENNFSLPDKLSQVNCLQQLQNIASYPFLREKLMRDEVRLHAMFFDIYTGNVYMFSRKEKQFIEICKENYNALLKDADSLEVNEE